MIPRGATLLLASLLVLAGCDRIGEAAEGWLEEMARLTPLPEERLGYVGTWEGEGMTLVVAAEGRLVYHREDGGGTRSLEAPIVRFEGDDIVAGFAGIETRFAVEEPPHRGDAGWQMTVDGVPLVRVSKETGPRHSPAPPGPLHDTRPGEAGDAVAI